MNKETFMKRWPNFKPREFACKCGKCGPESGLKMHPDTMDKLQEAREKLGFPFVITSGYRCPNHKAERRKSTPGAHSFGQAVDISARGQKALKLVQTAKDFGFTGVGIAQKGKGRFIHLDDMDNSAQRPRPWIWSY